MSRSSEIHALYDKTKPAACSATPVAFEDVGIRSGISSAVYAAFPDVKHPTQAQIKFLSAISEGQGVLLKDDTGTGKSFGLVLALLNKTRLRPAALRGQKPKPFITSLCIVPHRDLAYQMFHWIGRITAAAKPFPPKLSTIAQVLVRSSSDPTTAQISRLLAEPPHILIGTPQAVMDVFTLDPSALQLETLSTVVVDEADYLIESIPRKDSKRAMEIARKKLDRHPSPTKQLLDMIFSSRVQAKRDIDEWENVRPRYEKKGSSPQLVMSSATLRNHLKLYLNHSGWLEGSDYRTISSPKKQSKLPASGIDGLGGKGVYHHALVVSPDGGIRNIDGARHMDISNSTDTGEAITPEALFGSSNNLDLPPPLDEALREQFARTPSPFNLTMLETVATVFALDVPVFALLVLPASAPVQRAVHELRELGVNAYGLDLLEDDTGRAYLLRGKADTPRENPTLLVSTLATTRGIDMPELSHVFILGVADGRKVDSYVHIAGRVGRFGRGGKVISVLEGSQEASESGKTDYQDQTRRLGMIFRELEITPAKFEHFD